MSFEKITVALVLTVLIFIVITATTNYIHRYRRASSLRQIAYYFSERELEQKSGYHVVYLNAGVNTKVKIATVEFMTMISVTVKEDREWIEKETQILMWKSNLLNLKGPWKEDVYNILKYKWNELQETILNNKN